MNEQDFLAHPWSRTKVGESQKWSEPLRFWVRFIGRSSSPTILLWGPERLLLFNDAFAGLFENDVRSALGQPFGDFSSAITGAISPYVEEAFAGSSGNVEDIALPIGFGETERFNSFAYTPVFNADPGDVPSGIICSMSCSTAKIDSERQVAGELRRLHEVYEHAPGFIAVAEGPEHHFVFANRSYCRLVGRDDVIGKTVSQVLPEVVSQGFVAILDRVYETGVPFIGRGVPIEMQPDPNSPPEKRFIDTIYHPIRDDAGAIIGIFAEGHDVTKQVEAQNFANKLQAQLLRVSRATAMVSFGSAVAHEINQPLAAAVNYLGVARKLAGDVDHPDLVEAILSASKATLKAGDILTRMRTLAATGSAIAKPTDLTAVILEAITLVRMANPHLSIVSQSLTNSWVMADGVQIQQVVVNLLKNALEAMSDVDHPQVSISIATEGRAAAVRVEDNGPGIPPEDLDTLFDWFVTTKEKGSGIGLPISRKITEAFGGTLQAGNTDTGAAFTFTLPLAPSRGAE